MRTRVLRIWHVETLDRSVAFADAPIVVHACDYAVAPASPAAVTATVEQLLAATYALRAPRADGAVAQYLAYDHAWLDVLARPQIGNTSLARINFHPIALEPTCSNALLARAVAALGRARQAGPVARVPAPIRRARPITPALLAAA